MTFDPPDRPVSQLASLVPNQSITHFDTFKLESGIELKNVPVAYKTWGKLNDKKDNVMVICHALSGSADVEDWWGPLMGAGKAFDPSRYFIYCGNVIGSPYGTVSPVTANPDTGDLYGPEFPLSTIRDDRVLDGMGVQAISSVIGGSMGGMQTLEWGMTFGYPYIRSIIPIATSVRHSAWCISWGEAQRQSIYSDPAYFDGFYYEHPDEKERAGPISGLGAARMAAMLTYRSRDSFEARFGRKPQLGQTGKKISSPFNDETQSNGSNSTSRPSSPAEEARDAHNDGNLRSRSSSSIPRPKNLFTAQSYLRYQGDKFTSRFDANCYIHLTRKMDTHDIAAEFDMNEPGVKVRSNGLSIDEALKLLPSNLLVIGIESDGLFTPFEQHQIGSAPSAELVMIPSPDGHDGFLLEFEAINEYVTKFLQNKLPEIYSSAPLLDLDEIKSFDTQKTSVFGEAEANDITAW
ncbi:homoserine O-acetyltransferase [Wallemia mellicola]|uniref:Homoserine O-acetyltransferase n=1 Tax=Wallemia mellicola TaxID=1708541 RepID=A0A4T0TGJ8_9BASI|nr:homoserine O-acetyltransferase [Wallemia mellicola]TIC64150.1 homoserine O-acetyltransferase [Wallemia mellicola]